MRKPKYVFAKSIKVKEHVETVENIVYRPTDNKVVDDSEDIIQTSSSAQLTNEIGMDLFDGWYENNAPIKSEENDMFSDDLYETNISDKKDVVVKNTDSFSQYQLDSSYRVTRKEALTSIEAKTPFVVIKIADKKAKISENDAVYKTIPKIKYSEHKSARRVGYLEVAGVVKKSRINLEKTEILGLTNDEIPITKKKGFNQKKVGYIKLNNDDSPYDRFVEVTQSKGFEPLLIIMLIIGLIYLLTNLNMEGWHFNKEKLTLYKTEEVMEYIENTVTIYHSANPILKNGKLGINLTSDEADGLTYKVKITDNDSNILYESEYLEAGEGIDSIDISTKYEVGEYECFIECETYKNNNNTYIGTVDSTFEMRVRE